MNSIAAVITGLSAVMLLIAAYLWFPADPHGFALVELLCDPRWLVSFLLATGLAAVTHQQIDSARRSDWNGDD